MQALIFFALQFVLQIWQSLWGLWSVDVDVVVTVCCGMSETFHLNSPGMSWHDMAFDPARWSLPVVAISQ